MSGLNTSYSVRTSATLNNADIDDLDVVNLSATGSPIGVTTGGVTVTQGVAVGWLPNGDLPLAASATSYPLMIANNLAPATSADDPNILKLPVGAIPTFARIISPDGDFVSASVVIDFQVAAFGADTFNLFASITGANILAAANGLYNVYNVTAAAAGTAPTPISATDADIVSIAVTGASPATDVTAGSLRVEILYYLVE